LISADKRHGPALSAEGPREANARHCGGTE
jgi:hypothetical protein